MSSNFKSKSIQFALAGLLVVIISLLAVLAYYQWFLAVVGMLIAGGLVYIIFRIDFLNQKATEQYISTLSYRLKSVGEEALLEMPIGIMLIDDDYTVEWSNAYMASCFQEEILVGSSLYDLADSVIPIVKQGIEEETVSIHDRRFKVINKSAERLLYFFDVTEQVEIEKMYENERTVISIIYLDNYDELTQGMNDRRRSGLNSLVTSLLDKWAKEHGMFLKRTSSDRFICILNERILHNLVKTKFTILDVIRETTTKQHVPLTLSIGIGCGESSFPVLASLAQSSLDLALGRGGDQVAIKLPNGKAKFYGGKSNPVEKRTRVRARVISHALKDIILDSDKVIVMGHKYPDMDAIGAAIGISKAAMMNDREAFIVINFQELDTSVKRLMHEVKKNPGLNSRFISVEKAYDIITDDTLLVVVDTHKPSMVIEERLLRNIEKVVVIDHHRRGEEFIDRALLVYMEPYASSTAELVTELLEYQEKKSDIDMLEATALLAGIIVDTKSFTLRTGSRTFDAASYLRSHGADTVLVQKFLKDDLEDYMKRARLIETVAFYKEGIAIAKGKADEINEQILIAQAADTLLSMNGVNAAFVIAKRSEHLISISARSLGEINVQIIMELLNGGGHLTNAATQMKVESVDEAEERLKQAIDEYLKGGTKE
ncbi:DHH family phosphoesterase [Bacillus sp. AGMB 02131]|uniref:Cyclic-di-AMP phosphodiesterase n=1 Tax=Peribacillus faecalis TaxID=2772559 RepID=A0A927HDD8_9BACI|nr:DHH family phosphoesterase [Peribacillus faecalis]MBD3109343.1 DHH family phosphoesterase [Peribacillus faecalis]